MESTIEAELFSFFSKHSLEESLALQKDAAYFNEQQPVVERSNPHYTLELFAVQNKPVSIIKNARFFPVEQHRHDFVEICYQFSGQTVHIVDKQEIVLKAGEFLMMNQFAKQSIHPAGESDLAINILLRLDTLATIINILGRTQSATKHFLLNAISAVPSRWNYLYYKTANFPEASSLANTLIYSYLQNRPNHCSMLQKAVGLLMILLQNASESIGFSGKQESELTVIADYINDNYAVATLSGLASQLRYTENAMSKKVKELTGKTFMELLQARRMEKAAQLLQQTKMGVGEISHAVGYENRSYFYRLFKAQFGILPLAYRQSTAAPDEDATR